MKEITSLELKERIDNGKAPVMIDVREAFEYQICNIDNSVNLPMGDIHEKLDQLSKDDEIVVICHHGGRSLRVCMLLEQSGFQNVINMKGGVDDWARSVDHNMATY